MLWAKFKDMTTREHLDFIDALTQAGSVGATGTEPLEGITFDGRPVAEHAAELVPDFLDNGLFKFKEGSVAENVTDAGIALADSQVEWVDAALSLVGTLNPFLQAKPLANLPI